MTECLPNICPDNDDVKLQSSATCSNQTDVDGVVNYSRQIKRNAFKQNVLFCILFSLFDWRLRVKQVIKIFLKFEHNRE